MASRLKGVLFRTAFTRPSWTGFCEHSTSHWRTTILKTQPTTPLTNSNLKNSHRVTLCTNRIKLALWSHNTSECIFALWHAVANSDREYLSVASGWSPRCYGPAKHLYFFSSPKKELSANESIGMSGRWWSTRWTTIAGAVSQRSKWLLRRLKEYGAALLTSLWWGSNDGQASESQIRQMTPHWVELRLSQKHSCS